MLNKGFILILFYIVLFSSASFAQKKKTTSFFFDTDISALDEQQHQVFLQFISELDSADIMSISIFGYCDDRGRKVYNDTLSVKRANHIKNLLQKTGVNTAKINLLLGNGQVDLSKAENIEQQRANNRRVDLVIEYVKKNLNPDRSIFSDTLKIGDKITLENILFDNSKSVLLEESIPILEKITNVIKEKKKY